MIGQISMFDMLEPESRFANQLKHGSGFEGGKVRIYAAALLLPVNELACFLKDEFGVGGHSATFPDGKTGFTDYNPGGFEMRVWKTNEVEKHTWKQAAQEVKRLVAFGEYLTEKEKAKAQEIKDANGGMLPMPKPRMGYGGY